MNIRSNISYLLICSFVLCIFGCSTMVKNWTQKYAVYPIYNDPNYLKRDDIDNVTLSDVESVIDMMELELKGSNISNFKNDMDFLRSKKQLILEKLQYGPYVEIGFSISDLFLPHVYGADWKAIYDRSEQGEKTYRSSQTNSVMYMINAHNRLYYFQLAIRGLILWQDTQTFDSY